MYYLTINSVRVGKLLRAAEQLQEKFDALGLASTPIVAVTLTAYVAQLSIGDVTVWDTESGYAGRGFEDGCDTPDINVTLLLRAYRDELQDMAVAAGLLPAPSEQPAQEKPPQ